MTTTPPLFHAALSDDTEQRIAAALRARRTFASMPAEHIEQILHMARLLTSAPIASLNLVDEHEVIAAATLGAGLARYAHTESFCAATIAEPEHTLVVEDAREDPRFASMAVVCAADPVLFYAGVAILAPEGIPVATLCVMDSIPRHDLTDYIISGMRTLAVSVGLRLELSDKVDLLEEERTKFRAFMDSGPTIAYMKDATGRYTYANRLMLDSCQLSELELIGKTDAELWDADIASEMWAHDRWVLEQAHPVEVIESGPVSADGEPTWWQSHKFRVPGARPMLGGIAVDVTGVHSERQHFKALSNTDDLTGLPNRLAMDATLQRAVNEQRNAGKLVAVLVANIDQLKALNQRHGRRVGDQVLKTTGERIRQTLREDDIVFKLPGAEFVALLTGLHNDAEAAEITAKLREAASLPIVVNGQALQPTVDIGHATFSSGASDGKELLHLAEQSLLQSRWAS